MDLGLACRARGYYTNFRAPPTNIYKLYIIICIIVNSSSMLLYVLDLELARRARYFNTSYIPPRLIDIKLPL